MIIKARVMTKPKANTLDPQGVVVKSNLEKIVHPAVRKVISNEIQKSESI